MNNEQAPAEQGPVKKSPTAFDAVDVNWLVRGIAWPFPTWMSKELYDEEFGGKNDDEIAERLIHMFNTLSIQIDKAIAGDYVDASIHFNYFRKLSATARKMKSRRLKATLYQNPNYDITWMYVEEA